MSLVVITGGLSREQLSFIEEAVNQSFGAGVVTIKEYSLDDISLVKELRLGIKDSSVISVYLGSFSSVKALEKSRSMLENSGKFLEVLSTEALVEYLNKEYGVSIEYTPEPSTEVVETAPSIDVEEIKSQYQRLLEAKDGTIEALELRLEEQKNHYEGIITGIAKSNEESQISDEELTDLQQQVSSLTSDNESLSETVESLKQDLKDVREQKSELSSKFNSADALSRSQKDLIKELKGKLADAKSNQVDVTSYKERISELESELGTSKAGVSDLQGSVGEKDSRITELEGIVDKKDSRIAELEAKVGRLTSDLEDERRNVNTLNKRLISGGSMEPQVIKKEDSFDLPQSLEQQVWGSLWDSSRVGFKNITFLFAGTGDSHREAYLYAEKKLSSTPRGGIFYDLSTESVADYRFGVRRGHEVSKWYKDSNENLKSYLSKTKYPDVYVLGTFRGSLNEMSHFTLDLYSRLSYLDSLNVSVVVYGGDISSYFGRNLMSSALYGSRVEVVCRSLGTSARSMYFHSQLVGGSSKARYYLVGNLDDMSRKVFKVARRDGFSWEVLDA
jgi:condensin subunit smc